MSAAVWVYLAIGLVTAAVLLHRARRCMRNRFGLDIGLALLCGAAWPYVLLFMALQAIERQGGAS